MSKALFKTAYNYADFNKKGQSPTGKGTRETWGYQIDTYGRKVLKITGEEDVYAKIQENLEATKIENVLKRATLGDTSALRPDGLYIDTTEMPNNLIEARQAIQNLENTWAEVPNEIKAKYNYDVGEFIGASGSDSWLRDMGLLNEKTTQIETTTEVKTEEKGEVSNE